FTILNTSDACRIHFGAYLVPCWSEHNFQSELNLSRRRSSGRDEPCGRADPAARENDRVRCSEVCMVEGVEDLGSELHVNFLGYRRTLQQREIQTCETWPTEHSSP